MRASKSYIPSQITEGDVMAIKVTAEMYQEVDGQLHEIKRQLRQKDGYPFDVQTLRAALQLVIEGKFDDLVTTDTGSADTMIRINWSAEIEWPYGPKIGRLLFPELQDLGETTIALRDLNYWNHGTVDQNKNDVRSYNVLEHIISTRNARFCLGIREGLAIREQLPIEEFKRFFGDRIVFLWKSAATDDLGNFMAPVLYDSDGEIVLLWRIVNCYSPNRAVTPRYRVRHLSEEKLIQG